MYQIVKAGTPLIGRNSIKFSTHSVCVNDTECILRKNNGECNINIYDLLYFVKFYVLLFAKSCIDFFVSSNFTCTKFTKFWYLLELLVIYN